MRKDKDIYVTVIKDWPDNSKLLLGCPMPSPNTKVTMLGHNSTTLHYVYDNHTLSIDLPLITPSMNMKFAWTFKLSNLLNI